MLLFIKILIFPHKSCKLWSSVLIITNFTCCSVKIRMLSLIWRKMWGGGRRLSLKLLCTTPHGVYGPLTNSGNELTNYNLQFVREDFAMAHTWFPYIINFWRCKTYNFHHTRFTVYSERMNLFLSLATILPKTLNVTLPNLHECRYTRFYNKHLHILR